MSAIQYAVDQIKFSIPRQILDRTFLGLNGHRQQSATSVDWMIRQAVVVGRVLMESNLVGGTEEDIDLQGLQPFQTAPGVMSWHIPNTRTNNREIVSALALCYNHYARHTGQSHVNHTRYAGAVNNEFFKMTQAASPLPIVQNARVYITNPNVVTVEGEFNITDNYSLRCRLGYDSNANGINPASYAFFGELCVLAAKAFIYNEMIVTMDEGFVVSGQQMGSYSNIIESFSDAEQDYREKFDLQWRKIMLLNDFNQHRRHTNLASGGFG